MQRSVIKKYGIYSTFLFVVIFLSVLSVMLILTGILFPIGMILFEIGLFEQIFQYYDFIPNVQVNLGVLELPTFLNIPISIIVGIALVYIGKKTYMILRKYLLYVKKI
ncbi:hypothetical protein [Eisenbergiella sp.]